VSNLRQTDGVRASFTPLSRAFFTPSAAVVATRLLGHWLIRRTDDGYCGGPIVETEAYLQGDPASHGFIGERPRTRIMFGPPGYTYVYFIYGNHYCVNAVCRRPGIAEAVLIRAVEPEFGLEILRANRPDRGDTELTSGPGKLCAAMKIDMTLNGADLCDAKSPLFVARNDALGSFRRSRQPFLTTKRIGITKGADSPLRFCLAGSPHASSSASVK
jgi:DNA-3-methyladenine glycosylase